MAVRTSGCKSSYLRSTTYTSYDVLDVGGHDVTTPVLLHPRCLRCRRARIDYLRSGAVCKRAVTVAWDASPDTLSCMKIGNDAKAGPAASAEASHGLAEATSKGTSCAGSALKRPSDCLRRMQPRCTHDSVPSLHHVRRVRRRSSLCWASDSG